jgi:hypothetical protein
MATSRGHKFAISSSNSDAKAVSAFPDIKEGRGKGGRISREE